ncbi:MAG: efflux RND transporter periplasmic adaptor subunit [Deltaproteobacteria bacterium]|nr:efflux RND transporter periplasmic adaptor subunit [Deltaproteobacteria bacterium]
MKRILWIIALVLVLLGAGGAGLFWYDPALVESNVGSMRGGLSSLTSRLLPAEEKKNVFPFRLAEVERGEIFSRITTTGTVNPVSSVTVSTQVSGTIKDLPVDVPMRVKRGDLIARLDQDLFRAQLLQAEAKVAKAKANLAKELAGVEMLKSRVAASIAGAKAAFENLEEKHRRNKDLVGRNLISRDQYESIQAEYERAAARYREESARVDEVKVKRAVIAGIRADIQQAEAELEMARVRLNRSVVVAPISGVVIQKTVEAGQTVAASLSSPPLVKIAELEEMKVSAFVDEADIGRVKVGQEVEFSVDSYPRRTFEGKVVRIFPSPLIKDNVVTYDTEIRVPNKDLALKPGMTANVTIILARRQDVLIVPGAALRISGRDIRQLYPDMPRRGGGRRRGPPSAEQRRRWMLEGRGGVWVYRDDKPARARIRFGATDAKNMEIVSGLEVGDQVIVGIRSEAMKRVTNTTSRVRSRILGGL